MRACILLPSVMIAAGTSALAADLPVNSGLVLWLRADAGVDADDAGTVYYWGDQSGEGNDAWALGAEFGEAPMLVQDALNSLPAIRFDGVDDVLDIENSPSLQPGEGGWTVIFVGRHLGQSQGDYPQIIGSRPWLSGLDEGWAVSINGQGLVASHFADGATGHDVPQTMSASALSRDEFEMWLVEEDRAAGRTAFYRRGDLDAVHTTLMPEGPILQGNPVNIGREMGGSNNRRANVDLAEILIFNRVLSREERIAITRYVSDRYDLGFEENQPPTVTLVAPDDGLSLALPADLVIEAEAADPDGTIARVEFLLGDRVLGAASAPPYRFPLRVPLPATLELRAVAVDDRGERTTSAPVSVQVTGEAAEEPPPGEGLQLWLRADQGVVVTGDGAVTSWEDQSPHGNHAGPLGLDYAPVGTEAPLRVESVAGGRPAIRFDGEDDVLEISIGPSLHPAEGNWTVVFVARRGAGSRGDFPQIIGSRPWVAGLDNGWAVSFSAAGRVTSHLADGAAGHDVPGVQSASVLSMDSFEVWQVEEDRHGGATRFFRGGSLDAQLTPAMPAASVEPVEPVHIGREMGGNNNRRASMDLAEVLVFNRILTAEERSGLATTLSARYGLALVEPRNAAPEVSLIEPEPGARLDLGEPVLLEVDASDADGSIVRVEFYAGTRPLGSVSQPPFGLVVTNLPAGDLLLTARAIDNLGAVAVSEEVPVTAIFPNAPRPLELVGTVDYSDTFTVGPAGAPSEDNPRPDGMYNNDAFGGYDIEDAHGNPVVKWSPTANFSFNTPSSSTGPAITSSAVGNPGAEGGFAQSGGGDFTIAYGLRSAYVVQTDAIMPRDRLHLLTRAAAGDPADAGGALTVVFRRPGSGAPEIALLAGGNEAAVTDASGQPAAAGISDNDWHNFAAHFDRDALRLGIYVDRRLVADVDLATFQEGAFAGFGNGAVGVGGAGFDGTHAQWFDNFRVGSPSLVGVTDYSDTFTVGGGPRTDGLYNDNSGGAYDIEDTYGNPPAGWLPTANFSFNTPGSSTGPNILGVAAGNAGADTGLAQSGGGDFSIAYGLREDYIVVVDAVLPLDRLDISSLPAAGDPISTSGGLTVFLRRDSADGAGLALYNGSTETPVTDDEGQPIALGIDDQDWHRFAVRFDRPASRVAVFVDGSLVAGIDLATFAEGLYEGYSNGAVGVGGAGFNGTHAQWFDNFAVGLPGPAAGAPSTAGGESPTVQVAREGAEVVITWAGPGTLETATDVPGAWSPVPGAESPHRVAIDGDRQFFRVRE